MVQTHFHFDEQKLHQRQLLLFTLRKSFALGWMSTTTHPTSHTGKYPQTEREIEAQIAYYIRKLSVPPQYMVNVNSGCTSPYCAAIYMAKICLHICVLTIRSSKTTSKLILMSTISIYHIRFCLIFLHFEIRVSMVCRKPKICFRLANFAIVKTDRPQFKNWRLRNVKNMRIVTTWVFVILIWSITISWFYTNHRNLLWIHNHFLMNSSCISRYVNN